MTGPSATARTRRWAVLASTALATSAVAAFPASASVTSPEAVRPGHTITVSHNIDMVSATGYPSGDRLTVKVVRQGITIGSTSGIASFTAEGEGLLVNLGVEAGVPQPGDCWKGHTPDIRPGDHIVVSDRTGEDEVVVDDIEFTGQPVEDPGTGDVLVHGVALRADGTPIPAGELDSAAFRSESGKLRFGPEAISVADDGPPGAFVMRYVSPFAPSRGAALSEAAIRQTLLNENGHTIGFGHLEIPPPDVQLVEGVDDVPGPALGCEASPSVSQAATDTTPQVFNTLTPAGTPLQVRGFSQDATRVLVDLTDGDGTLVRAEKLFTDGGFQTWSVDFAPQEVTQLSGKIQVTTTFDTTTGGTVTGLGTSLVRDLDAPAAPTASLTSGTYRGAHGVALDAGADDVRYTLGDGTQAAPAAGTGTLYRGGRIRIASSQTLKAVAVDSAGNPSRVTRHRYRVITAPDSPRIRHASAGDAAGPVTATARWTKPLKTNGARITGYWVTALKLRANGSVASRRVSRVLPAGARSFEMRLAHGWYRFAVRAGNSMGKSPRSVTSNLVRPR